MDFSVDISEIEELEKEKTKRHFFTSFSFLDAHYGIRKGSYGVLLGSTGSGKSSLAMAIAAQSTISPAKDVLIWLSEETKAKYMSNGLYRFCLDRNIDINRIKMFEEKNVSKSLNHERFLNYAEEIILSSGAEFVMVDNITSSRFYGPNTSYQQQGQSVDFFKRITERYDLGLLAIMHTASDVSDNMGRLFTTEDVRGSKQISIEAGYFYALQKFTKEDRPYVFLRTLKSRDHDEGFGSYVLKYDRKLKVYTGDEKVDFARLKEIFESADRFKK